MYGPFQEHLIAQIRSIRENKLYKEERIIASQQGAVIKLKDGKEVLNFCANNYLGLSNHPKVIEAARRGLDERGYGMSSVRFICGTQDIHKELEQRTRAICKQTTRFYTRHASMLTAGCLSPSSVKKTRLFQMSSIMPV